MKSIKQLVTEIEKSKSKIAKERDRLRELHSELSDIIDSTDSGLEQIERGIDDMSQYL